MQWSGVVVAGGGITGALLAKIIQDKADVYLIDPYEITPLILFPLSLVFSIFIEKRWHFFDGILLCGSILRKVLKET